MSANFSTLSNLTNSTDLNGGLTESEKFILRLIAIVMEVCFPIGFVINILAFVTLCKDSRRNATENIFIGLTLADTMTNFSGIFVNTVILLSYYLPSTDNPIFQSFKYMIRADIVLYMISFTISGALSIERIFAVFRPTTFRQTWTPHCGIVTVLCACSTTTFVAVMMTHFISENAFLLFRFVFGVICVTVVLFSNVAVCFGLISSRSKIGPAQPGTSSAFMEKRQTKILIVISLLFVVCGSTNLAAALVSMLDLEEYQLGDFLVFVYGYARWLFQIIYSILNSIIFVACNKKYRRKFLRLVHCKK